LPRRSPASTRRDAPSSAANRVGRTIERTATLPGRINAHLAPFAALVGWSGIAALAVLGLLSLRPDEEWPTGLERARLPVYVTLALVAASLLGWTFVQRGQKRIGRQLGRRGSLWVFVFLPLLAAGVGVVEGTRVLPDAAHARCELLFDVARWVGPVSIAVCLAAFFTSPPLRGTQSRAVHALLVAPYAALLAPVVLGFDLPFVAEPMQEGLSALGGGAIAVQLVLAWFVA